jgi:hypothetical protein
MAGGDAGVPVVVPAEAPTSPRRPVRVFVSSTFEDLRECRAKVRMTIPFLAAAATDRCPGVRHAALQFLGARWRQSIFGLGPFAPVSGLGALPERVSSGTLVVVNAACSPRCTALAALAVISVILSS